MEELIEAGAFATEAAGPVCASLGTAVFPAVRTSLRPKRMRYILPAMRQNVRDGSAHAEWSAHIFAQCLRLSLPIWVESPVSSFIWRFRVWKRLLAYAQVDDFITDQCRWRAPIRKRIPFRTKVQGLAGHRVQCEGGHTRIILRGIAAGGQSWTKVAEPFPPDLCAALAGAVATQAWWSARRFCIAACAKCSGARIGKASNPRPRKRRLAGDAPDLALAEAVEPKTARLHSTSIRDFTVWLHPEGDDLSMEELIAMPDVADRLLRNYVRPLLALPR